jgi:hypothetical protein
VIPIAAFHGGLSILKGWLNAPWGQCSKLNQVSTVGSLFTAAYWCWDFILSILLGEQTGVESLDFKTSW